MKPLPGEDLSEAVIEELCASIAKDAKEKLSIVPTHAVFYYSYEINNWKFHHFIEVPFGGASEKPEGGLVVRLERS